MPVARRPKPPIVLFSNSWTMGGTEQHLIQLGSGLVARGYTVAAICSPRADIAPLRAELRAAGVRVHTLAERGRGRAAPLARLVNLIRTIHLYQGCTLHIHLTGHIGGELALVAGRLAGARRIIRTEHNPPVPPITARDRWVVRLRDRLLNGVICVSEATREAHVSELRRDPRKCVVVHNGVDLTRFNPAVSGAGVHAEFGLRADMTLVGTVARLAEERKGLADFLRMAAIVAGSHPRTRFVIVGDGPLRPVLEQQAQALGIGDRVIFTGARADVPRLLAAMHAFVIPSLYEACQYSLLEAMAEGRPVVATPAGIAPIVVENGTSGLLVPFGDSTALAGAVRLLLDDRSLARRVGQHGYEVIRRGYSVEAMVDRIVRVYSAAAA